jgi:hypothetical protein
MAATISRKAGPGRKPLSVEMNARQLCLSAIEKKFGSIEKGIIYLLETEEPALVKFAFEHAIGKPIDQVQATHTVEVLKVGYGSKED